MTLTIRDPEDLLALTPVMFGFAPADSVVMQTFGGPRPFHGRTDLPPRGVLGRAAADHLADTLLGPAVKQRVAGVALLFYSEDAGVTDPVWRALRRRCAHVGLDLLAAMRVTEGRYYPLRGDRRLREVGVAYDLSGHRFLAQAVLSGQVTYGSREELVASVAPDAEAQAATARALVAGGHDDLGVPPSAAAADEAVEWARGLVADHVADDTLADSGDLARLVWLLQHSTVRHAVWSGIDRRNAEAHTRFLGDVLRRAPDALVATPAALFAWAAWQAGNGALAWAGVDRCREVEPGDRLAATVARALERAVPPDAVDDPVLDSA